MLFGAEEAAAFIVLTVPKVRFLRARPPDYVALLQCEAERIAKPPMQRRNPPSKEKAR
jgi:hypothetical protein